MIFSLKYTISKIIKKKVLKDKKLHKYLTSYINFKTTTKLKKFRFKFY